MLDNVRKMVKAQQQCMEAASLILEAGRSLDDVIVLGEDAGVPPIPPTDGPETDVVPPAGGDVPPAEGEESPADPVPTDPQPGEGEGEGGGEEPMPLPGDDLPEPIGRQTGETPVSSDDDLLNMEVNLGSNTLRDVLPQPPANAADAIADDDDIMNTRVDAGFGDGGDGGDGATPKDDFVDPVDPPVPSSDDPSAEGEDPVPPAGAGEPVETVDNGGEGSEEGPAEESGDLLSEAISLGDDPQPAEKPAEGQGNAGTGDGGDGGITEPEVDLGTDTPAEGGGSTEAPAEENEVTAAVKDKVSEVVEPTPGTTVTTEDLLGKLSNVTKNIEDIKKGLIAHGFGSN